jgi:hypothetical protein
MEPNQKTVIVTRASQGTLARFPPLGLGAALPVTQCFRAV